MSAPSAAIPPDIGTIFLVICSIGCYSAPFHFKFYIYGVSFPKDGLGLKSLVYILFFIDVLQTAFATHYAWYVLAGGWGDLIVLNNTPWTLSTIPPLSGSIALLVQGFFSWRIWKLSQKKRSIYIPILGLIGVTAIGSFIAAWYAGIVSGGLRSVAEASLLYPEVTGWLAGSMACDSMITITLVWLLWKRKNDGFRSANHVVHRAIRMTIETGALTMFVSATELGLYLNSSLTTWYFMLGMLIGKLYSNSLLATLNSRSSAFKKSSLTSTSGAHAWDVRIGQAAIEMTTSTAVVTDTIKTDIELGRVQQTMTSQHGSKSHDLASD